VMPRPPNIESERLLLVALLSEEMEALIARDFARFAMLSGLSFPPDNPDIGDLGWHLRAIQADNIQGHSPDFVNPMVAFLKQVNSDNAQITQYIHNHP